MTPQEKKDVESVLKKFKRSKGDVFKSYLKKVRTGAILGIGLDLVFTAGFGTLALATTAAIPALKAAFRSAAKHGVVTRDPQQQQIKAGADVVIILFELELMLSKDYKLAMQAPNGTPGSMEMEQAIMLKKMFLATSIAIEDDIRKLGPAIKIVSGGKGNYRTDKYQILVNEEPLGARKPGGFHTLEEARQTVTDQITVLTKAIDEHKRLEKEAAEKAALAKKRTGFNL